MHLQRPHCRRTCLSVHLPENNVLSSPLDHCIDCRGPPTQAAPSHPRKSGSVARPLRQEDHLHASSAPALQKNMSFSTCSSGEVLSTTASIAEGLLHRLHHLTLVNLVQWLASCYRRTNSMHLHRTHCSSIFLCLEKQYRVSLACRRKELHFL